MQLFFLYYVLPEFGIVLPAFLTGALALGLQYAAYTSEVYRGGMEAVHHGQWEAATALNLTRMQTYRDIIIPQAIPRIVPAMGNYLVAMIKETPVLSVVTVLEMMGLANMIGERTFEYLVPLTLVGLIFLLLTIICSAGLSRLQRALQKQEYPCDDKQYQSTADRIFRRHKAVRHFDGPRPVQFQRGKGEKSLSSVLPAPVSRRFCAFS